MAELILTRDERLELKARAHHLDPVVLLGSQGLTEAVMKEIDRALKSHELIKVRVPGDDREEREAMYAEIAEQLGAARIQSIGKLLVFWRPLPPEEVAARSPKAPAVRPVAAKRPVARKAVTKATSGEIRRTERKVPPRKPAGTATGRRGKGRAQ